MVQLITSSLRKLEKPKVQEDSLTTPNPICMVWDSSCIVLYVSKPEVMLGILKN